MPFSPSDAATSPPSRVLIAVPIFNEIQYVARILDRLDDHPHDKLFIDDGSDDGTLALLQKAQDDGRIALIRHPENRGYGQSLIDAFNFAAEKGYDWVVTMDCDEQHDPDAIPDFIAEIAANDADIISGSRYLRPDGVAYHAEDLPPAERRAVNLIITTVLNRLFGWRLTDSFCGFKAHRVAPTVALNLDEQGYAFPLQLWPRAQAAGLRIREIPVRLIYNDLDRTFGHDVHAGDLDNARNRLRHYLDVLRDELCEKNLPRLRSAGTNVLEHLPDTVPGSLRDTLREGFEEAAAVPCP